MTQEDKNINLKDPFLWQPNDIHFTQEEEAYRRGFSQGFYVGSTRPDLKMSEILEWRYGEKETGAPGTPYENDYISGTIKKQQEF